MLAFPLPDHVVWKICGCLVDSCVAIGAEQDQVVVQALIHLSDSCIGARTLSTSRDDVRHLRDVNVLVPVSMNSRLAHSGRWQDPPESANNLNVVVLRKAQRNGGDLRHPLVLGAVRDGATLDGKGKATPSAQRALESLSVDFADLQLTQAAVRLSAEVAS